jgi:drug/metabolite transporter (DMT)-like permease
VDREFYSTVEELPAATRWAAWQSGKMALAEKHAHSCLGSQRTGKRTVRCAFEQVICSGNRKLQDMTATSASSNLRGVLLMLAAVAVFAVMDVALKRLVESYSALQVTCLRGIASLPLLLAALAAFGRLRDLVPQRWGLHAIRALLGVITLWSFVYSLSILSLADAYAIFMCAPLLITALSVPMLGDRVDGRRWLAVCAGMAGVLAVLRPSGTGLLTLGGLAALTAALGYALSAITIRILARTDTGAATVVWSLLGLTIISGIAASPDWQPLQWQPHWLWIVLLGITGAAGQYLLTQAFRRATPLVIAPLEYTALGWGMLFDWLLWMVLPNARMLIGATIIVGSGLYVIRREATMARPVAAATHDAV